MIGVVIVLIKNCIYCISILIGLFSIITLVYSIKNKNKYICNWIILIDIIYILYLIINLIMIGVLYIPVGLEVLFIYLIEFVAGILYVSSTILNLIKRKKLIYTKNNKVIFATIIFLLFPIILFLTFVVENKLLINNSDLVLVYKSDGNGGFGDSKTFAYAIGKDFCKQFDLGIDIGGYDLKKFLPVNAVEINDLNVTDYEIIFNDSWEDNSISVYKNNKEICKVKNKSHYFNIDFEKGFYIKH